MATAYTHALRCMVYRLRPRTTTSDPHGPYIAEKAAMCKLFSIEASEEASPTSMLEIFGGDGYFEDSPYGPTERLYRDCTGACGWRRAPPPSSASLSPATARSSAARSSAGSNPLALRARRTNLILHEGLSAAGG